ncbi:MAG: glucose/galactose MFS transporter, partial [Bacteroidales bacterium]|nr:glucose/galactose MFS transporter [Bacteroidales bacterium]
GIAMETARNFPSLTLLAMMLGYLVGIILIPRYLTQRRALAISAILGLICSICAVVFSGTTSVIFIILLGFANAVMWPAIWPLALEGVGDLVKIASSILIMGILGGAVIPQAYGALADYFGNKPAYLILIPCYLFILFFAGYRPPVNNNS